MHCFIADKHLSLEHVRGFPHRRGIGGSSAPPAGLENFQGNLCFQGKRKLLKNSECKKYIQYSEFMATLFFRASAIC